MDAQQLHDHITKLEERVRRSSQKSQFGNSDILVLAVSKTRPPEDIRAAHAAGLSHFGENYLQEALPKVEALSDLDLTWHFIGPLQSNKTRAVAEHFDWVHSVDREKIARRLSEQRPAGMPPLNICLQVNVSGEATKSGVAPDALADLATAVQDLPGITLRGLMAIPAPAQEEQAQRRPYRALREAFEALRASCPGIDTLSMGMSADLEAAIAEGATLVRVGTDLFGPRSR